MAKPKQFKHLRQRTLLIEDEVWLKFKEKVQAKGHSISYVLRQYIDKYLGEGD